MNMKKIFVASVIAFSLYGMCPDAYSKVNFLPGGGSRSAGRAVQSNPCTGYNLRNKKCENEACAAGWNCVSCNNARGTFYKCTPRTCDSDYKAGKMSCPACQKYAYKGFSGNQICGKCTPIAECTTSGSQSFTYINGVKLKGKDINKIEKTGYKM